MLHICHTPCLKPKQYCNPTAPASHSPTYTYTHTHTHTQPDSAPPSSQGYVSGLIPIGSFPQFGIMPHDNKGTEPESPALAGRFPAPGLPGKPIGKSFVVIPPPLSNTYISCSFCFSRAARIQTPLDTHCVWSSPPFPRRLSFSFAFPSPGTRVSPAGEDVFGCCLKTRFTA